MLMLRKPVKSKTKRKPFTCVYAGIPIERVSNRENVDSCFQGLDSATGSRTNLGIPDQRTRGLDSHTADLEDVSESSCMRASSLSQDELISILERSSSVVMRGSMESVTVVKSRNRSRIEHMQRSGLELVLAEKRPRRETSDNDHGASQVRITEIDAQDRSISLGEAPPSLSPLHRVIDAMYSLHRNDLTEQFLRRSVACIALEKQCPLLADLHRVYGLLTGLRPLDARGSPEPLVCNCQDPVKSCLLLAIKTFLYQGGRDTLLVMLAKSTADKSLVGQRLQSWSLAFLWVLSNVQLNSCWGCTNILASVDSLETVGRKKSKRNAIYVLRVDDGVRQWKFKRSLEQFKAFYDPLLGLLKDGGLDDSLPPLVAPQLASNNSGQNLLEQMATLDTLFRWITDPANYHQILGIEKARAHLYGFLGIGEIDSLISRSFFTHSALACIQHHSRKRALPTCVLGQLQQCLVGIYNPLPEMPVTSLEHFLSLCHDDTTAEAEQSADGKLATSLSSIGEPQLLEVVLKAANSAGVGSAVALLKDLVHLLSTKPAHCAHFIQQKGFHQWFLPLLFSENSSTVSTVSSSPTSRPSLRPSNTKVAPDSTMVFKLSVAALATIHVQHLMTHKRIRNRRFFSSSDTSQNIEVMLATTINDILTFKADFGGHVADIPSVCTSWSQENLRVALTFVEAFTGLLTRSTATFRLNAEHVAWSNTFEALVVFRNLLWCPQPGSDQKLDPAASPVISTMNPTPGRSFDSCLSCLPGPCECSLSSSPVQVPSPASSSRTIRVALQASTPPTSLLSSTPEVLSSAPPTQSHSIPPPPSLPASASSSPLINHLVSRKQISANIINQGCVLISVKALTSLVAVLRSLKLFDMNTDGDASAMGLEPHELQLYKSIKGIGFANMAFFYEAMQCLQVATELLQPDAEESSGSLSDQATNADATGKSRSDPIEEALLRHTDPFQRIVTAFAASSLVDYSYSAQEEERLQLVENRLREAGRPGGGLANLEGEAACRKGLSVLSGGFTVWELSVRNPPRPVWLSFSRDGNVLTLTSRRKKRTYVLMVEDGKAFEGGGSTALWREDTSTASAMLRGFGLAIMTPLAFSLFHPTKKWSLNIVCISKVSFSLALSNSLLHTFSLTRVCSLALTLRSYGNTKLCDTPN